MGFVKKAVNKKKAQAKNAAKAKAKKTVAKVTPGMCPKTGGKHRYKNQNTASMPVLGCNCGKVL